MDIQNKKITDIQRHIEACSTYVNSLEQGYRSPEKLNTLLDAAMQQIEMSCIEMRRLTEEIRPALPNRKSGYGNYHNKEIFGEITLLDNGWLDIRLEALLPHCKTVGCGQYVTDSITRLLNKFKADGGEMPTFEKAFIAIVEHCPMNGAATFDHDNKGFKSVINALKGRLFQDDDQFELSLGLFTVQDEDVCCHIYITPYDEAGDFLYQLSDQTL